MCYCLKAVGIRERRGAFDELKANKNSQTHLDNILGRQKDARAQAAGEGDGVLGVGQLVQVVGACIIFLGALFGVVVFWFGLGVCLRVWVFAAGKDESTGGSVMHTHIHTIYMC